MGQAPGRREAAREEREEVGESEHRGVELVLLNVLERLLFPRVLVARVRIYIWGRARCSSAARWSASTTTVRWRLVVRTLDTSESTARCSIPTYALGFMRP